MNIAQFSVAAIEGRGAELKLSIQERYVAARLEIARNLLKSGMDLQFVINVIGLIGKGLK
ncbi:hypothetical protein E1N66_13485 [Pantoea allii]|nr:hypothetical protein [Pantoea allii]THB83848.1 hypothetical protein E1N66_13485 [Pantoea allii]